MGLSATHLLVVALVVLLLFGGNRLADLGKGLGVGLRNFKQSLSDDASESKQSQRDRLKVEASE